MGGIRNFSVIMVLMWVVGGCLKQPETSIIPQISLQSLIFKKEFPNASDSLIIVLRFSDGDGDLGIDGNETAIYTANDSVDINTPYYFAYDSVKTSSWRYTHYSNATLPKGYKWVNYASHRKIHTHPFDTLPSNLTCKSWELRSSPTDTLYIQSNPYNNNIFVDVWIKDPSAPGGYTFLDPANVFPFGPLCVTNFFNGRFPILSSDLGKKSPLDGTITYKIQSPALWIYLRGKIIKIKVYILDRAFHKSNNGQLLESGDLAIPN